MAATTDETSDTAQEPRPLRGEKGSRRRALTVRGRPVRLGLTRPSLPTSILLILLLLQGAYLTWLAKDIWFVWGDDYDFLLMRGTVPGVHVNWLVPHDDHWMTSVVVIFRVLFHFFGIRSYLPYGLVPIAMHLAIAVLIYSLVRRLGSGPWMAMAAGMLVLFGGAGAQAVLWDTTMGLLGSLLFGLLAVYLSVRVGLQGRGMRLTWLALVLGLTFSGTGVVAVCYAAAYTWSSAGWRMAVRVLSVPTGVFLVWYFTYGQSGVKPPLEDRWSYLQVPSFVWTGLTSALGSASAVPDAGGALTVALLLGTVVAPRHIPQGLRHLALAGIIGALVQLTLAALTRPAFGIGDFSSGRYGYLTMVFLTPAVVVCLSAVAPLVKEPRHVAAALACFVAVAYVVNGQHLFRKEYEGRLSVTASWPGIMRGIRAAAQDGERVLTREPSDFVHKRFRADLAAHPAMWKQLPEGNASERERLEAEQRFFVSVSKKSKGLLVPTTVDLSYGFTTQPKPGAGCSYHETKAAGAVIVVATGETGAEVGVFGPVTKINTALHRDGLESNQTEWPVKPGVSHFVSSSAKDAQLYIGLDRPGNYMICKG